ncbi:MAG: hypothetical protein IJ194_06020 [Bacilli bacterium]|nr:hypothetical protein [Bacilli bacterium]
MCEKILVLVEGADKEMSFFKTFNQNYIGLGNDIELVPLCCNIYSLYREMREYDFDIDLEKAIELSPSVPPDQKQKIYGKRFGTKYLVFDFDFQENSMSDKDKLEALSQMLSVFDNDSENGLLFINYPMFESFQEVYLSKEQIESNKVYKKDFSKYKSSIDKRKLAVDCKSISNIQFQEYILSSLKVLNYIFTGNLNKKLSYKETIDVAFGRNVFNRQQEELINHDSIYAVNTSVLVPIYYFGEKKYKVIS